jgi:hypothetical protein
MPATSKFTADRRETIIQALRIGASLRSAAATAGIEPSTLTRWLQRGERAREGSLWREFRTEIRRAQAEPKLRALGVIWRAMPDRPDLAWKFVERREEGFANTPPSVPDGGPIIVQLRFDDGRSVGALRPRPAILPPPQGDEPA